MDVTDRIDGPDPVADATDPVTKQAAADATDSVTRQAAADVAQAVALRIGL